MSTDPYRVLIVEDDTAIRKLVQVLLQRRGIVVDAAHDGREAMEKIRGGPYSVLVLDLMLPEVNGFEVIDFIRQQKIRLPVAVVSAVSQQVMTKLDLDVVKLVIPKPFDVEQFTNAIVELCAGPS